jgi:hypothetical protein
VVSKFPTVVVLGNGLEYVNVTHNVREPPSCRQEDVLVASPRSWMPVQLLIPPLSPPASAQLNRSSRRRSSVIGSVRRQIIPGRYLSGCGVAASHGVPGWYQARRFVVIPFVRTVVPGIKVEPAGRYAAVLIAGSIAKDVGQGTVRLATFRQPARGRLKPN